ncbi:hypothetical protein Slin14017_G055660 [Septoria linicola]|nr:hypothetical protein Slin14017_G055660 [Septoria linicola]
MFTSPITLALVAGASASTLWDGRLNDYSDASFLSDWSWSNQVGPYQYYIHGSGAVSDYVALSADYKNPEDTSSEQGIQITIDDTSSWNGQNMMRTELIPSTTAAINAGKVFYHFSMQHTETNAPSQTEEHQICFFESHFTELKYGESGGSSNTLRWMANSETQWNATLEAGVWHNVAYGIDFDAQTVTFYHSTGADALEMTAGPISATTDSNGADWHLGVLRLPGSGSDGGSTEDWHFSGVYIEDGDLTTTIGGTAGGSESGSSVGITSSASPATTSASAPSSAAPSSAAPSSATPSATATSSAVAAKLVSSTIAVPTTLQTLIKPASTPVSGVCIPITETSSTTSATAAAATTSTCPAAGETDDQGRYSCNPAHQYPSSQTCELKGSCYFLVSQTTTSATAPSTTTSTTFASDIASASADALDAKPTKAFPEGYTLEDLQSLVAYLELEGWNAEEA